MIINNNLIFYGVMFQVTTENNGKINNINLKNYFVDIIRFEAQAFSNGCLLIRTFGYNISFSQGLWQIIRFDIQLNLVKEPNIEISKTLEIHILAKDFWFELIGLK